MATICFSFQVHQPARLRRYTSFDTGEEYFDAAKNAEICRQVSRTCYLPANRLLQALIDQYGGHFKVAFSIPGVVLEQFSDYVPEVLESFHRLADTGCVEFLNQTYYRSLSYLFSPREFTEQVIAHRELIQTTFGQTPRVFHNVEPVYDNGLAQAIDAIGGFDAILIDNSSVSGTGSNLNRLYQSPSPGSLRLLLKNRRLSDDIALRFTNRQWSEWPLTSETFARWLKGIQDRATVVNLCFDYETFGEHCTEETGIFDFFRHLPGDLLKYDACDIKTPHETVACLPAADVLDAPERDSNPVDNGDLSAWLGNAIQRDAAAELYRLEPVVKATQDPGMLTHWRKLQTRDHFSYMDMQLLEVQDPSRYAHPYDSPYDSYINFMNVLTSLKGRCVPVNAEATL